jgi:hypothetical protein
MTIPQRIEDSHIHFVDHTQNRHSFFERGEES